MSQNQDDELIENKEALAKDSLAVLGHNAFQGWKGNTKGLKEKTKKKSGKLILGQTKLPPNNTSQHSSFVAEGHQITLNLQEDSKSNGYTLGNKIQTMVDDSLSIIDGKSTKEEDARDIVDKISIVDDENITARAVRACLAAEAVFVALREECNLLPAKMSDNKEKNGHARRGCNCPGKGATCNGAISLQLQLAACENLSFAATAAFRELVVARLGMTMTIPSQSVSPKKQRKKPKSPKKLSNDGININSSKTIPNLQAGSIKRRSTIGRSISLAKEQLNLGPFSCSHPMPPCTAQCEPPIQSYAMLVDEDKWRGDADSACERVMVSKSKFKILFCDMDGTLLNSKSILTRKTADALREVMKIGVLVIIATGKTRPAAMAALDSMGLAGKEGIVSESTPGVFIQGLQVCGKNGKSIHNIALDTSIVEETFLFSVEHQAPLAGFCGDRCVTLFAHTLIEELHDVFYEPKAEVLECMDQIKKAKVQKVVFHDSAERVTSFLRPHWTLALQGRANVVQSLPDMLEVLPSGASKGAGVQILLDHLDVSSDEIMAIGDGENDIEMLTLAGLGVAMGNANSVVKAVAKAITTSNDEDGVAKAIQKYIL